MLANSVNTLPAAFPAPQTSPPHQTSLAPTIVTCPSFAAASGTCFTGAEFPDPSTWLSFDALVAQHTAAMAIFDSSAEIADVQTAVQSVAQIRVIFVQMSQESQSNVHTATGDGGVYYGFVQIQIIDYAGTAEGNCTSAQVPGMFKEYLYRNGGSESTFAAPRIGSCLQANGNDVAQALRC
ncbi:hypothetical protein MMC08_002235 [Hypocenomyce scalaris]|nr:hypothetical protein [Hypocenomyce scalaris]